MAISLDAGIQGQPPITHRTATRGQPSALAAWQAPGPLRSKIGGQSAVGKHLGGRTVLAVGLVVVFGDLAQSGDGARVVEWLGGFRDFTRPQRVVSGQDLRKRKT